MNLPKKDIDRLNKGWWRKHTMTKKQNTERIAERQLKAQGKDLNDYTDELKIVRRIRTKKYRGK